MEGRMTAFIRERQRGDDARWRYLRVGSQMAAVLVAMGMAPVVEARPAKRTKTGESGVVQRKICGGSGGQLGLLA